MIINLYDDNLLVSYLQIFLRDYFGVNITYQISDNKFIDDKYIITTNSPLKVTGEYNLDTYASLALYMVFNYPNEGYPYYYILKEDRTVSFDSNKLLDTINNMIKQSDTIKEWTEISYDNAEFIKVFTWNELLIYFKNESDLNNIVLSKYVSSESFTIDDINNCLVNFINKAKYLSLSKPEIVQVSERVLSYILGEVVSPKSSPDEIMRIQKIMYPNGVTPNRLGVYDNDMMNDVINYQKSFIERYTTNYNSTESNKYLPQGYYGFKVTGYVDPWTELIISGGI